MTAPNPGRMAYGQLADLLAEQEKRIGKLEQGSVTTQLSQASVVAGTLPMMDQLGRIKMLLGRQSDGTFAVTYANGDPPPPPAGVVINAIQGGYVVGWDGTFVGGRERPGDFARIDIHEHPGTVDDVPVEDFEPTGATVRGSLANESAVAISTGADAVLVKAVAVTLADVPSVPTGAATVQPLPISRIAAGSVGALELAAEIALLGELVLGLDPAKAKVRMGGYGLRKIEPDGTVSLALGADTEEPNYLSVLDPVTGNALASISADGTMTARRFAVAEEITTDGESLSDQLGRKPAGLIAWYARDTSSALASSSKIGVAELRFTARRGAMYRIQTSSIIVETVNGPPTSGQVSFTYTLDGSTPTVNSAEAQVAVAASGGTATLSKLTMMVGPTDPTESKTCRMLLCLYPVPGSGGARMVVAGQSNIQFWVEEISPPLLATESTGGASDGSGTSTDPSTRTTRRWSAAWSGSWSNDGVKRSTTGQEMLAGNSGDGNGLHRAAIGFDFADIQAKLAGATIKTVRLYLNTPWWFHNDGGWMVIGMHNSAATASPDAYPGRSAGPYVVGTKWGKPEARWIDFGATFTPTQFATIANALKTGTAKGFVVDRTGMTVNTTYPETSYAARVTGAGMTKGPELEITLTSA